jgi:hypothetical protein
MGNDFWRKITCLVPRQRSPSHQLQMKLTGEPPSNSAERLVKKIAGNRRELPLEWLEKQVCHELHVEELRLTWYTADIGICGRDLFRQEASLILAKIRPEFGYICQASKTPNKKGKHRGSSSM